MTYRVNADGMLEHSGTRTVVEDETFGGKYSDSGAVQTIHLDMTGEDLADTLATADVANAVFIPAQSYVKSATLIVDEQFTPGGSATLDLGTYTAAGAAIDADGIDVDIAVAALTDNAIIACDGAVVGTVVTADSYLGASYETAAFTAGHARLVVEYIKNPV